VEVPETSKKTTQSFRIHNITRSIKYSNLETSGNSGASPYSSISSASQDLL
jgi:hypothetical protein